MPRARMRSRNLLRYSSYCSTHRGRLLRQGDIDQRSVTKTELASYQRLVQARIERNPASPAWDRLDDAWLQIVGHAKGILAAEKLGRAGVRHKRIAAREVVTVADAVPAREVVVCRWRCSSMEPRKFRSDDGFRTLRGMCDGSLMPTRPTTSTPSPTRVSVSIATLAAGQPRCSVAGWRGRWADPGLL
jgi:hypothetical protein